ncbi:MAG: hypothetical protein KDC48_12130, partial [Planctomycetes bacterium]|nr:hypothetical protein [Planctomycetota bacterium]
AASTDWHGVPLRVDLQTGRAEQLGDWTMMFSADFFGEGDWYWPGVGRRRWRTAGEDLAAQRMFDLQTGAFAALDYDAKAKLPRLTDDLRKDLRAERAATADLRAPGGQAVWTEGASVVFAETDGTTTTMPLPGSGANPRGACGHGVRLSNGRLFDLTHRKLLDLRGKWYGFAVRGLWVLRTNLKGGAWQQLDVATNATVELPELAGCGLRGLFDDEHLLCVRRPQDGDPRSELLLYRPADRSLVSLATVPDDTCEAVLAERWRWGSLLPRDPAGRIWLHGRDSARGCVVIAPDRSVQRREVPLPRDVVNNLITWTGTNRALVMLGWRIVEMDLQTDAQTVLFPKEKP